MFNKKIVLSTLASCLCVSITIKTANCNWRYVYNVYNIY